MNTPKCRRILSLLLCVMLILSSMSIPVFAEAAGDAPCAHRNTAAREEAGVAASCTTEGSHTVITECADCGEELSRETVTDEPSGHDYQETDRTEASCGTAGSVTYTCSRCGDSYTEDLPALEHDYQKEETAPTCTEAGKVTYTCSLCGDTYTEEGESAPGHDYQETARTEAAYNAEGSVTYTCSRCGDSYTEAVPKLNPDTETPTETFSVFFELCGHGDEITPITAEAGSLLVRPDDPQAEGYVFQGWYRDAGYETSWDFDVDTVTEETTLYAYWVEAAPVMLMAAPLHSGETVYAEGGAAVDAPSDGEPGIPVSGYTLTLNPNYSGAPSGTYVNVTSMDLPSLTRSGYLFLGWSETSIGSVAYRVGDTITLTSNKTLFAVWGIGTLIGGIPVLNGGYVYLGGIRWRVIGVDSGKWLLISADVLGGYKTWEDANSYCGTVFNGFSSPEQNVVLSTTKTDDAAYGIYAASNLSDAKLFLLSASEAVNYFSSDADRQPGGWWLRSSIVDADYLAGCVNVNGVLSNFAGDIDDLLYFGARPAFQLNLASVLFESAAEGGKSSAAAGGGEFGNFQASSTNGRKLTLLDSDRSGFSANVAGASSVTVVPGGTLALTYSGANTGTNEYVSAMLTVGDNTYYASLTSAGSGTWNLTLPADLAVGGSYTLKVFGEQQNGEMLTDYASSPVEITLTVSDTVPTTYAVTVNGGSGGGDYAEGASVTITANEPEAGMQFKEWTSEDGVTFTDASSATTTFTMPAQAVTITATYEAVEAKPEFHGHQLVLSGQIGVKFGMNLSMLSEDEKSDSYMEFTINGRTTRVNTSDAAITDDGRYVYTCYVTSIQMAEPITAVFHYNEDTVQQTYSVKDYIDYLDENASDFSEAAVSLVHAIADYGHYAQPFLSATNNWTIGTDYAEMSRFFTLGYDLDSVKGSVNSYQMALTKGDFKVDTAYMRLTLDSETALSVRLTVTDNTELSATATFHGNTYQAVKQSDGSYIIKVTNIPAAWLGDTVTITGTAGGDFTVTVSALSYVYSVLNSETMSAEAKNAVASLYYYYTNTVAYRAESNQ